MKKLTLICAAVLTSLMLVSCGKAVKTADGFYNDFDDTKKAAVKNNKNILLIITAEGDQNPEGNDLSTPFMDNVVRSNDFGKLIWSDFTVCHMDFSEKTYMTTVYNENSTKEEEKLAKKNSNQLQKNSILVSKLNPEDAPAVYLFTKDGNFIGFVDNAATASNAEEFKNLLDTHKSDINLVNELVEDTKKGSNSDKLMAIDRLFEATPAQYRVFLSDMINKAITLDKKNESGLMAKYLMAKADYEAVDLEVQGNIQGASKKYADVAENAFLGPLERQQSYYMAAYVLGMSGDSSVRQVLDYLQKSMEAYPEGEVYEQIKATYDYFEELAQQAAEKNGVDLTPQE